jgi:ABC-type antimicrobial peptide transport system permease subunit
MAQLPLRYTTRNLMRRKTRTLLTLLGVALVVGAVVFMLAFSRSLSATFRQTGDPDNLIVISKKARTFVLSSIAANNADQIRHKFADVAKTYRPEGSDRDQPMISPEVYIGLNVDVQGAETFRKGEQRGLIHGLDPELAMQANSTVKLVEGRVARADRMEVMVGSTAGTRIGVDETELAVGRKIRMLGRSWKITGRFAATGTMMDCEIWAPVRILQTYLKRWDYSFIRIKLKDVSQMDALCKRLSTDEQFEVKAFPEQVYFADYAEGFDYFRKFAQIMAIIIIGGGLIAGMNTMYTAVLGRIREIGMLQVIGFSKRSVLVAILTESLFITLVGGFIGCVLGYLANGLPMKIPMAAFRIDVDFIVFVWAMLAALFIGLGGAYLPAYRALKLRMVDAVRAQ